VTIRCNVVPAGDLSPAVVLLVRKFEHFTVLRAIAISVYERIPSKLISLQDPSHLLRAGTISMNVPAGQPTATFLERRADVLHAMPLTPRTKIHVERTGHDHDIIPLRLVPLDALFIEIISDFSYGVDSNPTLSATINY
jgi:hypothetical protein